MWGGGGGGGELREGARAERAPRACGGSLWWLGAERGRRCMLRTYFGHLLSPDEPPMAPHGSAVEEGEELFPVVVGSAAAV